MAKAKCKLDFIELPVPDKIQFARDRVDDMTGNAYFTTPDVPLANITTAADDLETAYNAAQGGGPAETAAQNAAEAVLDDLLRKEAAYVDRIADGDVVKITSAGFTPTETTLTPVTPPAKPENMKLKHGEQEGTIIVTCDKVENAKGFVTIITPDQAATIAAVGEDVHVSNIPTGLIVCVSSGRKTTHGSLRSATRYYVRRYAFNAAGRSPDTDVISIVAP
jgi:hypothetical protein